MYILLYTLDDNNNNSFICNKYIRNNMQRNRNNVNKKNN